MIKKPVKRAKKGSVKSSKKGSKSAPKTTGKWLVDKAAEIRGLMAQEDAKNPPREMFQILQDLDEVCSSLHEANQLMDAAMYDLPDLNSDRSTTLLCIAERTLKQSSEKAAELSTEMYRYYRMRIMK
jgi:hypothetical protein